MGDKENVDAYLDTIRRLEPDIAMIDAGAAYASIAISLKRIADAMTFGSEKLPVQSQAVAHEITGDLTSASAHAIQNVMQQLNQAGFKVVRRT